MLLYFFNIKDGMHQIHATSIWRPVSTVTCLIESFSLKCLIHENGHAINNGLSNSDLNLLGLMNSPSLPCIYIIDKYHTCNESVSHFLHKPMTLHMDVQYSALCLLSCKDRFWQHDYGYNQWCFPVFMCLCTPTSLHTLYMYLFCLLGIWELKMPGT